MQPNLPGLYKNMISGASLVRMTHLPHDLIQQTSLSNDERVNDNPTHGFVTTSLHTGVTGLD